VAKQSIAMSSLPVGMLTALDGTSICDIDTCWLKKQCTEIISKHTHAGQARHHPAAEQTTELLNSEKI